jgi:hypothetical protein
MTHSPHFLCTYQVISSQQTLCCQVSGAWGKGHCATDDDCGPPQSPQSFTSVSQVLDVFPSCFTKCQEVHGSRCSGAKSQACLNCSNAVPCIGYAISNSKEINSTEGGSVYLANGAGMRVPPNVWPEGVRFSHISCSC